MSGIFTFFLTCLESVNTFINSFKLGRSIMAPLKGRFKKRKEMEKSKNFQVALEISTCFNRLIIQISESKGKERELLESVHLARFVQIISLVVIQNLKSAIFPIFVKDENNEVCEDIIVIFFRRQISNVNSKIELMNINREEFNLSKNFENFENIPEEIKHKLFQKILKKCMNNY